MCVFFLLAPMSERHMLFVTDFLKAQLCGLSDLGTTTDVKSSHFAPISLRPDGQGALWAVLAPG